MWFNGVEVVVHPLLKKSWIHPCFVPHAMLEYSFLFHRGVLN